MPFDPTATRSGSIFSDVPNYAGAWVCYVNGIEVPVVGWQIDTQVWQIPSFTIHCIPDTAIQRLGTEDRVPVQLFYLDYWADDKPQFRLLVDGEVVGWHFSSSTGSRTIAFSCLGHIQIFQQLYFFYMTNVDDIVASRSPESLSQGFQTPGLLYPYAIFHQGLLSTSAQATNVTPRYDAQGRTIGSNPAVTTTATDTGTGNEGTAPILAPYEMVTNVIKGVISSKVPQDRRAIPMMNFFARYIRKMRFHNRWVRLPLLEDAAALNDRKGVFPIFNAARNDEALVAMQRQVVSQVGSSGPVWNLFQQVLGLVYMEIAMIPNPVCVRVKLTPLAPNQPEEGKILRAISGSDTLTTYRHGLITTGQQATDPLYRQAEANVDATNEFSPRAEPDPYDFLPSVDALLEPGGGVRQGPGTQQGVVGSLEQQAQQRTRAVGQEYARLVQAQTQELSARNARDLSVTSSSEPVRLAQYFVKPNFFFGEVPSCNVIMPSMIDSWTYDESYINQPTRVYVNDSVMTRSLRATGNNREFMLHALTVGWPEEANALMHHKVGVEQGRDAATSGADHGGESGRNLLVWPEEFYKGPVTARAEIPSWFQMLQQFANGQGTGSNAATSTPDTQSPPVASTPATTNGGAAPVSTAQGAVQASVSQAAENTGPAPVALPGSQFASTSTNTQRSGNSPSLSSSPAYALPTQVRIGGESHGRFVTRLAVGGVGVFRNCLGRGTGLDPANYLAPEKVAPWPFTASEGGQAAGNRRGRAASQSRARPAYTPQIRMAMLVKAFTTELQTEFPQLTEDQRLAVAFGFVWITFQEGGVRNGFLSWNLGNQRQYRTNTPRNWTINPYGNARLSYVAAPNLTTGIRNMIAALKEVPEHAAALNSMVTGRPPVPLAALIAAANRYDSDFWRAVSPIRPDFFYMHLGYVHYYAGGFSEGLSRTLAMPQYFTAVKNLISQNRVPEPTDYRAPIDAYYQRPLYRQEDEPLLAASSVGAGSTPNASGAGSSSRSVEASAEGTAGDAFSELFKIYAQYEYLKQRYAQRSAGANMRFNPYILVGFPSMLFDSQRTGMHCVGYVVAVSHMANAGSGGASMSTTVRMQFCRTLQEFIYDVQVDAARFNGRITSAPAEIIDEIRAVIQDDVKAEEFYQKLLYGGAPPRHTPACFRWERVMGYANGVNADEIYIEGDTNSTLVERERAQREAIRNAASQTDGTTSGPTNIPNLDLNTLTFSDATQGDRNAQAAATTQPSEAQAAVNNLGRNGPLSPRLNTAYADAFDNYHIAMQLASRPACSLEDFVRFWHGGRTINDLLQDHLVEDPRTDLAYAAFRTRDLTRQNADGTQERGNVSRVSATYYGRIFRLRPGPGPVPSEIERGYTTGPDIQPTSVNAGMGKEYPETRANWDEALIAYRERVRRVLSPTT